MERNGAAALDRIADQLPKSKEGESVDDKTAPKHITTDKK
jgi:hypothetical protein